MKCNDFCPDTCTCGTLDDEFEHLLDQTLTPDAAAFSRTVAPERVTELLRRLAEDKPAEPTPTNHKENP